MSSVEFWMDNVCHLFYQPRIIPHTKDNFAEQMNCMTRLIIVIFTLIALFTNRFSPPAFVFCIVLLCFLYYTLQSYEMKECYGDVPAVTQPVPPINPQYGPPREFVFSNNQDNPRTRCDGRHPENTTPIYIPRYPDNPQLIDSAQSSTWRQRGIPIEESFGQNQKFVGPPNPKTLVQPVIPTPIYEFDSWRPNDFVIPRNINDQRRQEFSQNGYIPMIERDEMREEYSSGNEYHKMQEYDPVNTGCGYQPINLDYELPINYASTACQKTDMMKEYNKNLFTIPLQPGLYTHSEVNQNDASMSNLGISYTQPFLPTTFQDSTYVEHAGVPLSEPPAARQEYPLRNEIYDPRLTGYGPPDRHYIEPMTGQSRFYYDDIDQHTQTNYLTRNKIDFANFGTNAGPMRNGSLEGTDLRATADEMYTNSQIGFRSDLQQRLMHKNSNREWQQRIAPISTMNQRRAGGGTSSSAIYSGPRGG